MSPYPEDPVRAVGPMRIVISTYPSRAAAGAAVAAALDRRLAACANLVPIHSRFWWKGTIESAEEALVLFKTVPKRVGALLAFLELDHPYETPEVVEIDVPRANVRYLRYLATTLDPPPAGSPATRPVARRVRAARGPARTRAPRRRRSK